MSDNINNKGFNIVELNIAMTVSGILAISFFVIFSSFLVTTTRTNYAIQMTSDSQNLLRSMVEELRYGAGVRQTNIIPDPNPDAPAGGWNTSNANLVIITAVPALDSGGEYIISSLTGQPYLNEFVYYKQGNILYKRTLANPSATGNRSTTSCTVESPTCPADRQLIETLDSMAFTLYDQDNNLTTDPLLARSILIDLGLKKDTFGEQITYDNSIRSTLRNNF